MSYAPSPRTSPGTLFARPAGGDVRQVSGFYAGEYPGLGKDGHYVPVLGGFTGRAGVAPDEAYIAVDEDAPQGTQVFDAVGHEAAIVRHFGASYGVLERHRPDVASLGRFSHRIEVATFHMCMAFDIAGIRFEVDNFSGKRAARSSWLVLLTEATFERFRVLRQALVYDWTPPAEVEPIVYSAFHSLCDLAPASSHSLKQLFFSRREYALSSLVTQLDATARLIEQALMLRRDADEAMRGGVEEGDDARLSANQDEILARAGEALGLRPAAERLGMSHQNLHKRIKSGSALGIMRGRELIVPSAQFVDTAKGQAIVPELRQVLSLFEDARAGDWSALEYLTTHDPLLEAIPMDLLKAGKVDAVVHSARSYLEMDES